MSENISYHEFITVGQEMKGQVNKKRTFIEALDVACENNPGFPKDALIRAFAECLYHNGIIKEPNLMEICLLDSKVISKFGRNYRMLDLFDACASFYMIREDIPRTNAVEVRRANNVVHLGKSAS